MSNNAREFFQQLCVARLLEKHVCSAYEEIKVFPEVIQNKITGGTDWFNNARLVFPSIYIRQDMNIIPANEDFYNATEEQRHQKVERLIASGKRYTWVNAQHYPELSSYYAKKNREAAVKLHGLAVKNAASANNMNLLMSMRVDVSKMLQRLDDEIDLQYNRSC